jgi:hypothetical protein
MDIIDSCLSLVPVPYLRAAFSTFKLLWDSGQRVQASKEQLRCLSFSVAQLLYALHGEIRAGNLDEAKVLPGIAGLEELLHEVASFVRTQASHSFVKLLFTKDDRIAAIEGYHRKIEAMITAFQA